MSSNTSAVVNYMLSIEHELTNTKLSRDISFNKDFSRILVRLGGKVKKATYRDARYFYIVGRDYTEIGNKFFNLNPDKHLLVSRLLVATVLLLISILLFNSPIWLMVLVVFTTPVWLRYIMFYCIKLVSCFV